MLRSRILPAIAAAVCLLSCVRRPLDVLSTGLRVRLSHETASPVPDHFRVNMYDAASGKLVYKDFVPRDGGMIRSLPGDFLCFVCNFDEGELILQGEGGLGEILLTAPEAEDYYRELYMKCLTRIRGGSVKPTPRVLKIANGLRAGSAEASVPILTERDEVHTINVDTAPLLKRGYVSLENIRGIEYIARIDCFVTNLCAGVNPVRRELDRSNVAQVFTLLPHGGKADGTFLFFGINPGDEPRFLYALVTDTSGGQFLYVYDIGAADDGDGLHVDLDSGMDIPQPPAERSGGFKPGLGDWGEEYERVLIGR